MKNLKLSNIFIMVLFLGIANAHSNLFTPVVMQAGYCAGQFGPPVPWYCSQINQAVYNEWVNWLPIAILAVMMSFSLATVLFMFGVASRSERIRNFGIGELYEATASAIIVGFFMLLAAVLLGVLPAMATGPIDPYNTSIYYINNTINATNNFVTDLYNVNMLSSFAGSVRIDVSTYGWAKDIIKFFTVPIQILFTVPAESISSILMGGLLVLNVEYYLILFGVYAAIPVFLITGVVLRSFIPTRTLGGVFMGIAIAFYFIMPVLFSISYYFTHIDATQPLMIATQRINEFGVGIGSQENALTPFSPLVTTVNGLQSSMGAYWLSVLFYPALILAITYFSITIISDFIGGFTHRTSTLMSLI